MFGPHFLFDAICTKDFDLAADKQACLITAITKRITGIAQNYELPDWAINADIWPILPCTTMLIPFMEMPQREEALPLITSKPTMPGGTGILAGVTFDDDFA